jgi:hypothetical protein
VAAQAEALDARVRKIRGDQAAASTAVAGTAEPPIDVIGP